MEMQSALPFNCDHTLIMNNRKNKFNLYNDLIQALDDGNSMVKQLIQQEMELSAQCRVCGNVFKSLKLFVTHKELYCLERAGNFLGTSFMCPDPSSHGVQTVEQEPKYVPMGESQFTLRLETEAQARKKDGKGSSNAKSEQETSTKAMTGATRKGRKARPAPQTKRSSRAKLVPEKTLSESTKVTPSPVIPEKTPVQLPSAARRPRKPQIRLLSPLHSITERLALKATSRQETEGDNEEVGEQSSINNAPGGGLGEDNQTLASEKNSVVPAAEDSTSGGDSAECKNVNFSLAEEEGTSGGGDRVQDPELGEQPCPEEATVISKLPEGSADLCGPSEDDRSAVPAEVMELDCPKLSPFSVDCPSVEMEHDLAAEVNPPMQAADPTTATQPSRSTSTSRVAPGHAGSSQPAVQKSRTSTRERKTPKWMLDHEEEEARVKATPRKRAAPTDSAEVKEGDASTKRRRMVRRPDDHHNYAKPADMRISPVKITKIQRLPCSECTMTFANRKSLTFHVKQQHGGQRTISYCHLCYRLYQYAWGLKRHLERNHHLSDEQLRDCSRLGAEDIAKLRRRFQPRPTPASNRVVSAAQGNAGPSAALSQTGESSSNVEPARAVGEKTVPCPGKTEDQRAKADVPTPAADSPSRMECRHCGLLFTQEAIYEDHLRMRHSNEMNPRSNPLTIADRLYIRLCSSHPQQSSTMTSSSGSSKMVEAAKGNGGPTVGGSMTPMAPKSSRGAETPALPESVTSGKTSEAADTGMTQTEKSTRAEDKDTSPTCSTASPSPASTETLRAVVKRRGRKALGLPTHPADWSKQAANSDDPQSGPIMVKINEPLPSAAIEHIFIEPGRKQLEIIWIDKQPGKPAEKVNSITYVVEDPPKPKDPDTSEVDKMVNTTGDKGAVQGVRTHQSSPDGRTSITPCSSNNTTSSLPSSTITNPIVSTPTITNPIISTPTITNPVVSTPTITNPIVSTSTITNPMVSTPTTPVPTSTVPEPLPLTPPLRGASSCDTSSQHLPAVSPVSPLAPPVSLTQLGAEQNPLRPHRE